MFNKFSIKSIVVDFIDRHTDTEDIIGYVIKYCRKRATQYALVAVVSSLLTMVAYMQDSIETIVDGYCTLSQGKRKLVHDAANAKIYPSSITILCEGDVEDE